MLRLKYSTAAGLLFMRVAAGLLLLVIHGLPKLIDWSGELQRIEDPFGLGAPLTLGLAVFAEVVCPVLLILGVFARLACLPVLAVLLVALGVVHPDWTLEQGQFAWLLLVLFGGLALTGPGRWSVDAMLAVYRLDFFSALSRFSRRSSSEKNSLICTSANSRAVSCSLAR